MTVLDHTHVAVRDLDRSLAFYVGMLRLNVLWDSRASEPPLELAPLVRALMGREDCSVRIVQVDTGGRRVLELIEFEHPPGRDLEPHLGDAGGGYHAFAVEDLPVLHRRLRESGYHCLTQEPVTITFGPLTGGLVAMVVDPDGVPVEL